MRHEEKRMTLLDMARQLEGDSSFDSHGNFVEEPTPATEVNAHGVDITDDDLPENLQPKPDHDTRDHEGFELTPPPDPSQPHKINDAAAALRFIMAGNAYFTVRSIKTGTRYTYRVSRAKNDNPRYANSGETFFVALLTGPQNETDYSYMGIIRNREFRTTGKSRYNERTLPVQAFRWVLGWLQRDAFPPQTELWHEGRCGRCGRKLTVPESIEAGIGPECAGRKL